MPKKPVNTYDDNPQDEYQPSEIPDTQPNQAQPFDADSLRSAAGLYSNVSNYYKAGARSAAASRKLEG
jgi:hypothetical protein